MSTSKFNWTIVLTSSYSWESVSESTQLKFSKYQLLTAPPGLKFNFGYSLSEGLVFDPQ